jgi:CBS domain-containing membrane protein
MNSFKIWLKSFRPQPMIVAPSELWWSPVGAGLGLLVSYLMSLFFIGESNPWFIAPMGASAILLFAAPASPLAQPWSIIGGNTIAALIAVICQLTLGPTGLTASIAVAITIGLMMRLRCLHPPSGAVALTAVLGGPAITKLGFNFVFAPVLLNSTILLIMALLFNKAIRRNYPHHTTVKPTILVQDPTPITHEDVLAALYQNKEYLDIDEGDIESILNAAEVISKNRHQKAN